MNIDNALSVSQLNKYVKALIESDDALSYVTVRAEISNLKRHTSGHFYFTLKDEESEISAVMFRFAASKLTFVPKNGMKIVAYGRVSVYEVTGKYQLNVGALVDDGAGMLHAEFVRLFEKLKTEGLFSSENKKEIPRIPKKIGIVTSPTGAAIRDMINVTGRRYPLAEILLCPASVQGADAPEELRRSLMLLDALGECDVIIIGRGGGSAEDLWAFNDEELVRAVAAARTPIISAVGHETDTTLCDYAADLRAPTPSAAAELAVPDRAAIMQSLDAALEKMEDAQSRRIDSYRAALDTLKKQLQIFEPTKKFSDKKERLSRDIRMLDGSIEGICERKRLILGGLVGRLEAVDPLKVISRGYSVTKNERGEIISSVDNARIGEEITVLISDGEIRARITKKKETDDHGGKYKKTSE